MANLNVLEDMIEDKLLNLHTAYIAKVISFDGTKATVQPLGMTKQYGKKAERQSIVSNAPVIQSARFKIGSEMRTCGVSTTGGVNCSLQTQQREHFIKIPLAAGDLVFCVCAERDITEAKNGNIATPQIGHHSLSDSVVVGIL